MVPNQYLIGRINSAIIAATSTITADSPDPRSELESHDNMLVFGNKCFVFDSVHGRTVDVAPFDPSLGLSKKTPIVDAAVAYDFPYNNKNYILLARNAIHVPSMYNNLIPPFILRASGALVHDVPNIHVNYPGVNIHSILFTDSGLQIQLQLWGIFYFFHSRVPTHEEITSCDKILITPDSADWDPYPSHFSDNEESMLDWEGQLQPTKFRKRHAYDQQYVSSVNTDIYSDDVDSVIANSFIIPSSELHFVYIVKSR